MIFLKYFCFFYILYRCKLFFFGFILYVYSLPSLKIIVCLWEFGLATLHILILVVTNFELTSFVSCAIILQFFLHKFRQSFFHTFRCFILCGGLSCILPLSTISHWSRHILTAPWCFVRWYAYTIFINTTLKNISITPLTNYWEYFRHLFGINATVVGHIFLTSLVNVQGTNLTLQPLSYQSIQQWAAMIAKCKSLVVVNHKTMGNVYVKSGALLARLEKKSM